MKIQQFTLTIAQAATTSNQLGPDVLDRIERLAVYAPADLAEGARVQASPDGQTWHDIDAGDGTPVTVAAGNTQAFGYQPFRYMRIELDVAAGAERTFELTAANPHLWD